MKVKESFPEVKNGVISYSHFVYNGGKGPLTNVICESRSKSVC